MGDITLGCHCEKVCRMLEYMCVGNEDDDRRRTHATYRHTMSCSELHAWRLQQSCQGNAGTHCRVTLVWQAGPLRKGRATMPTTGREALAGAGQHGTGMWNILGESFSGGI
jgi:hypothetical protein